MWGGTLLCLGWLGHGWQVATPGLAARTGELKGADYIQFYVMGSRIHDGRGDLLYDMDRIAAYAQRRISPRLEYHPDRNPYGPQVALAFEPLARLPFLTSLGVFSLASLVVYAIAVWLLWRHVPGLAGHGRYVALVAAASPALLVTLRFGQISTMTLLAATIAAAALAREHRVLTGLGLGFLAYKPQLLVVALPMLLVARDWRVLSGLALGAGTQLMLAWAGVGTYTMQQYLMTLADITIRPDVVMLHPENSHSLRGALRLLAVPPMLATGGVAALVLACAPALARAWRDAESPILRVSLLVLLTLLLTPHLLTYDLLLLAVPIMALAEWATTHAGQEHVRRAIVLAVLLYVTPFSPVIAEHAHVQLSTVAIAAAAWFLWTQTRRQSAVKVAIWQEQEQEQVRDA
jgi:alpha-1,2-mannosyltransferase